MLFVIAAVDCEVGPWQEWGECDVRCGPGVRQRTRPVIVTPLNGGEACPPTVEKTACDGTRCKYPRASAGFDELRGLNATLLVLVHLLRFYCFSLQLPDVFACVSTLRV